MAKNVRGLDNLHHLRVSAIRKLRTESGREYLEYAHMSSYLLPFGGDGRTNFLLLQSARFECLEFMWDFVCSRSKFGQMMSRSTTGRNTRNNTVTYLSQK